MKEITVEDVLTTPQKSFDFLPVGATFMANLMLESDDSILFELQSRLYRLQTTVLQDKLAEDIYYNEVHFSWPKTTWQMFKHTNASKWWLKWLVARRPVVYQSERKKVGVTVTRSQIYPEATIPMPKLGRAYIHEMVRPNYIQTI